MLTTTTTGFDLSAQASVEGWFGIGANAETALSQSRAVHTARSLEAKRSGSLFLTESQCNIMRVQMHSHNFHPQFLSDLSKVETASDAAEVIEKYGTHYYRSAVLGGKLSVMSVVDKKYEQNSESRHLAQQSELTFSAGVSAPVMSVKGEFSDSFEHEIDSTSRGEYEASSTRSSVLTFGGAPGSFGPSSETTSSPSSYAGTQLLTPFKEAVGFSIKCNLCVEWAETIDLLPIPINYELKSIYSIIPPEWTVGSISVRELWEQGEQIYFGRRPTTTLPARGLCALR
jgi:hypothetical protein